MTEPHPEHSRRMATNAAQVLTDVSDDMVLVVLFRQSASLDDVRATIETVLASPAVRRIGVAPLAEGDPHRRN